MTRTSTARGMIITATVAFAAVMFILAAAFALETGRFGWRAIMAAASGGLAGALALAMWRLPRVLDLASFLTAAIAAVGLGASIPAMIVGLRALGEGALARPGHVAFDLVVGIASAVVLAFLLVGLLSRAKGDSAGLLPPSLEPPSGGYATADR